MASEDEGHILLADQDEESWLGLSDPFERCDCPSAPLKFLLPPPPSPPDFVGGCAAPFCRLEPAGAEFSRATFPSLPVIAVCSSVVLVAFLVACFLLWRHKTKVQNLLPCKHDQQAHCDLATANSVTYEDVLINHHPTRLPPNQMAAGQTLMPMELLDVKLGDIGPPDIHRLHHGPYFTCPDGNQILSGKHCHPVYEEISREPSAGKSVSKSYDSDIEESGRCGRSFTSEDDFAEDEFSGLEYPSGEGSHRCSTTSSVQGSTGGDLCRDPVSSDEGAGDDCDCVMHNLPGMMTVNETFNYPQKQFENKVGDDITKGQALMPKTFNQTSALPNRTGKPNESQRQLKQHISPYPSIPVNDKHIVPSSQSILPCNNTYGMQRKSKSPSVLPAVPQGMQWSPNNEQCPRVMLHSPLPIENIYSTIDDDITESDVSPTSASRMHQGFPNVPHSKCHPVVPKKVMAQNERPKVSNPRSQQSIEEESESYGDILPAVNPKSFT